MKRASLFVAFAALCGAQTTVNGGRDYKGTLKASGSVSVVDFSGAGSTAPAKAGTSASRPTACTQGQIYFATDAAAGQNLYFCTVTGAPGVWSQMSGGGSGAMTAGAGAPAGSCAPPALYIDTTNQDLWFCSATNSWKKPTADTSGFATVAGTNTWTGSNTFSGSQLRTSGGSTAVDFSGAGSTAPAKAGTAAARPTACTQGQVYFSTDAAAGQNLYFCTTTGAPGVWTQMSGTASTTTAGAGAPSGNCTPPVVYIDTTNQNLWFCGAVNSWSRSTMDTTGLVAGANTWTGYNNFSGGQWRPPESTVANLPAASGNAGKVFMVTDAVTAGSCSSGGGSVRELCRASGSSYECVGGCGSAGGGGGNGAAAYISSLMTGPDTTRTITGATHGFATTALLVGVYDNASPRNAVSAGWTVNPSTYDVTISFASPQSNYYVVINGGVGPQGPAGATGAAGSNGSNGAGYLATSTTSLAIGTGSTAFTTQAALAYSAGARVRASSAADGSNYMEGLATAYSGTTLTINVTSTGGSGTHADWNINLAGQPGANGAGSGTVTSASFTGGLISVTSPTTTPAFTVAGTSGGIPYFASGSTWASSGALAANGVVLGGGAGSAPTVTSADSTTTHALFATAGAPAFRAIATGDIPILNQNTTGTAANVTGTVAVANGGTGTSSALTGVVRGSATAMTAAELSGDVTTSGSNAVTIDANYKTRTVSVTDLAPVAGDSGLILVIDPATAIHLTRVFCATRGTSATASVNLDKRTEGATGTDVAHLLGAGPTDLSVTTAGANTTTWNAANCGSTSSCAIGAHAPVVLMITALANTPTALTCSVDFTVDQ